MFKSCGKRAQIILLQAAGNIARAKRLLCPCEMLSNLVETVCHVRGSSGLAGRNQPLLVSAGLSPIDAKGAREK
jgi:hypothetical protein